MKNFFVESKKQEGRTLFPSSKISQERRSFRLKSYTENVCIFITKDLNNIFLNFLMIEKLFYCTINKSFHLRDKPKKKEGKKQNSCTHQNIGTQKRK